MDGVRTLNPIMAQHFSPLGGMGRCHNFFCKYQLFSGKIMLNML